VRGRGRHDGGDFYGFYYGRRRDSSAIAGERRRLKAWKMKRKQRGLGVVAAGGAWHSGGTDLDWRQRLFDLRWKEGASGPNWGRRTGPKGRLGQLDAG
jgi:hypothetical protein